MKENGGRGGTIALVIVAALLGAVPVAALSVPASLRIPRVKDHPVGTPAQDALFSHQVHSGYQCYACHPAVFPQGRLGFTHADMAAGRFCGSCHEGTKAAAINTYRCEGCHAPK